MSREPVVHVVDDDQGVRDSLVELMKSANLKVKTYADAKTFLAEYRREGPACLMLDLRMQGMGGLELQEALLERGIRIPVIFMTAFGAVPLAVQAMRKGAMQFLEKPLQDDALLAHIQEALKLDAAGYAELEQRGEIEKRLNSLSPREREVCEKLALGMSPKEIGAELGLSHKTVHIHRANLMRKLNVDSIAGLVRLVLGKNSTGGPSPKG